MSVSATEAVSGGLFNQVGQSTQASPDKNLFLQLMVTQLQNQDPMNPTDSTQFLSQTAQFTALEKMQDVADKTSELLSIQMAFGASSLVGRTVTYPDSTGTTQAGVVDSVRFDTAGPVLSIGGQDVPLTAVTSVTGTPAA
jgi:flagellar basal-body rod modification protein FlgD